MKLTIETNAHVIILETRRNELPKIINDSFIKEVDTLKLPPNEIQKLICADPAIYNDRVTVNYLLNF